MSIEFSIVVNTTSDVNNDTSIVSIENRRRFKARDERRVLGCGRTAGWVNVKGENVLSARRCETDLFVSGGLLKKKSHTLLYMMF